MNLPLNLFDGDINVRAFLCQPDKTIIGEILFYDSNANFKFNTYSEISFTIDKYYNDLFDGKTKVNPYYEYVESLRVIYLLDIGYFTIQDIEESEDDTYTKSITCFSIEYTTGQRYLENFYVNTGEEGSIETMYHAQQYGAEYAIDNYYTKINVNNDTFDAYERYYIKQYEDASSYNYVEEQVIDADAFKDYIGENSETTLYIKKYPNVRFYWPTKPELSLLHNIFDRIPEWKIGYVDKELWYQERTFSEDRVAVYDFLYNQAAETLKYVMVWDSIKGEVSFYKTTEDGVTADNEVETQWNTDVFISKDNLASAIDIKYSADDIKTKLKITGSDTLDVRDVNLGQNYILDLSYYIPKDTPSKWVGYHLQEKYNKYVDELAVYTEQYKKLISAWSAAYNEYNDLMNYVPVDTRAMLVGDEFEKLYCIYNFYNSLTQEETQEMKELQQGGNVDLFHRPQVPSSNLADAGWDDVGDSICTVFTNTYSNDEGTIAINVTPILPNGAVMSPDELEGYAGGIIYGEIEDYEKLQIGYIFEGENAIAEAENAAERIHELQEKYYLTSGRTVDDLVANLQTKLDTYRVDQEDDKTRSPIAKSDDVLLTLENNNSDSVTIRIRYEYDADDTEDINDKPDKTDYRVYRTLTMASTGISNTTKFTLKEWVSGDLTAKALGLEDENIAHPFKIKSIGTLGAYFCLVKDEMIMANLEDYGIRLLEEKRDTYTKIFIVQTEGYMNKEGSQCITSNELPKGNEYPDGTKWLDTDTVDENGKLIMKTRIDGQWVDYTPQDNDYENYARFYENYVKLSNVQTVLAEKQITASYLLNGIAVNTMYVSNEHINSANLLSAAVLHLDDVWNLYDAKSKVTLLEYNKEFGFIIFTVDSDTENKYAVYVNNGIPYFSYAHSQGLCLTKMNKISQITDMNNYFTKEEIIGLSPYIREDEYSDDNFLLTGYESEEEQMNIKQELLKTGDEELKKLRQPKLSFSATMANILSIPEFAPLKNQFKLGNFIRVGIREGYVKRARLLEVQISFDDRSSFSATFGDLISTKSEIDKHADLLQQAVTAGKSVAANQGNWQRAVDKSTELDKRINDGLKDAALSVGSADGQSITWDTSGIWGKKVNPDTGEIEPEQFRLTNNKLVFSSDGFKTSKAVFGKYVVNGETRWGPLAEYITADMIEGKFIKGGSIQIGDENEQGGNLFIVNPDGSVEIKSNGKEKYASKDAVAAIDNAYRFQVMLEYDSSTVFSDTSDTCTITCKVLEYGTDITSAIMKLGAKFSWIRSSVEDDTTWDADHSNQTTNTITITTADLANNAQFACMVDFDETKLST